MARLPVAIQGAQPPYAHPDDHAIVVGIDHYSSGIPQLQGSINDCHLFCRWLLDTDGGGLDPSNVRLFISDPADAEPIRDQIEDLILQYYEHRIETGRMVGRRLYLFFSGHGVVPPKYDEDCGLVMANASAGIVRALIGGMAARKVRQAALFNEVMLVMDCCRQVTGSVFAACDLPDFSDPTLTLGPYTHVFAAKWASATAERLLPNPLDATESHLHHGVLTHALLRGLATGVDDHGVVTALSLKTFVRKTVEELLGTEDPRRPHIQFDEDLPPMSFGASRGVPVEVKLQPGSADFRVLHGIDFTLVNPIRTRLNGTSRVWLMPGIYLFEGLDPAGHVARSEVKTILQEAAFVSI